MNVLKIPSDRNNTILACRFLPIRNASADEVKSLLRTHCPAPRPKATTMTFNSERMAQLYLKYKAAGVPCELHIYSNAGHGFGYRPGTTSAAGDWPERLRKWLRDSNLLGE